ncbi:succinylglutamate desuccinylase [Parashewanella curva]|uniref:Succinylglutamate desuccinylase n=1 Tax=Parashewanella curva TaxID=2338552 RepID=A0A3L8Q0Z8_9GAMM|nr:succinylglutamate desuccinylase [Parashewanella curva]RLV61130.1 succinylglutamate desuccinylase [Parashewanella curva]
MLQTLLQSKDFLSLTLANPETISESFSFELADHTDVHVWDTGVIVFEPKQAGNKDIVLSCAVHGNETAPIEICNQLIKELLEQSTKVKHRTLFLIGNPPAIHNGTRFVEENMNRLFSGNHSSGEGLVNQERVRAKKLEDYVDRFYTSVTGERHRIHYDLHTAIRASKHEKFAIYPFRHGKPHKAEQIMFLEACGVDTILFHHEPTTTFSYFSSNGYGADAFTVELGKVRPFGENDMTRFVATHTMLTRLITGADLELSEFDNDKVNLYQVCRVINKNHDDFAFNFANDVENFRSFPKGYVLATEGGEKVKIEHEEEAIVFPNANIPVGQRAVIMLLPVAEPVLE